VPLVNTTSNQSSPAGAVGISDEGIVHLLWVGNASGYAQIFYGNDVNEPPIIGTNIIDEPNTVQGAPAIAVRETKVFACWQDARWVHYDDDADIYFTESGSGFTDRTNILVNDDYLGNKQTAPAMGIDKDGNPYVVWTDNRNKNNDIYYAGAREITSARIDTEIVVDANGVTTVRAKTISNLQVTIPKEDAGIDANDITIASIDPNSLPAMPEEYGGFGIPYEFGPAGLQFEYPVTVRIPFTDDPGYSVYNVYRYDPSSSTYWSDEGIYNPATHSPSGITPPYVEVEVAHFSILQPGGYSTPSGDGGGDEGDEGISGCAMSPYRQGNVAEFLLPYVAYIIVLLSISWIQARGRRRKCDSR
jgi:hypothetical protein